MRLGGRLAAAIEILDDIETRHRPAAEALKDWGISHRFAGSGDRAAIGNIVYDALRLKASTCWRFGEDTGRAQALGALLAGFAMDFDGIRGALEGDRFAPEAPSEAEQAAWSAHDIGAAPDHVRAECPDWCAPMLEQAFGDDWIGEGRALAARPPLDLRVNTLKASRDKVVKALARAGARPAELAPHGIRIPPVDGFGRHPNVTAEPSFQKGWFEVQDEGSQIVAHLAAPEGGAQVFDYCAGAGGKTLAIAAAMENRGQVHAYDADKNRLAPIFERLKRAGTRNVQVHEAGGDLSALAGSFDVVVVDAPCTGSGTWRRRPDAKWRLSEQALQTRLAEQRDVLDAASSFVKPGGQLVYITCSVFPEENNAQITAFLERTGGFEQSDGSAMLEKSLPAVTEKARVDDNGGIWLTPARTGTDGFFFAAMQRSA